MYSPVAAPIAVNGHEMSTMMASQAAVLVIAHASNSAPEKGPAATTYDGSDRNNQGNSGSNGQADSAQKPETLDIEAGKPAADVEPTPPQMSLWSLFLLFLQFGCNAFGGPVVQIAVQRFNRTFAMYQALPGPEAMELCCFFGLVARGRIGAFLGGFGFLLPGFLLCLLFSWLYTEFHLFENEGFLRSFNCVRAAIPALIVRSVHKIGEGALQNHEKKEIDPLLMYYCFAGALLTVFNTPFFIAIIFTGVVHVVNATAWRPRYSNDILGYFFITSGIVANIIYISLKGPPSDVTTASGLTTGDLYGTTFVTGLLAGLLTFGGAYTAIPFVRQSVVVSAKWMTDQVFLDGIALVNCLPTPLVMFVCFDGFYVDRVTSPSGYHNGIVGAILMTVGIFLPAFSFTLVFHEVFEKLMDSPVFMKFLDGVAAGVVGLIIETSWTLIQAGVRVPMDALVFVVALMIVYTYRHRLTTTFVIGLAALSGQVLYDGLSVDIAFFNQLHNTTSVPFDLKQSGFKT